MPRIRACHTPIPPPLSAVYEQRLDVTADHVADFDALGPLVYYVHTKDGLIKIGTTTNVVHRLYAYGVPLRRLLAWEPGSYVRESERLAQFRASLHHGREWHKPTPDLLDHIDTLRHGLGLPPVRRASRQH